MNRMKNWIPSEIQKRIDEVLPKGRVIPRHDERGHFYEVDHAAESPAFMRPYAEGYTRDPAKVEMGIKALEAGTKVNPVYPSVTGKLQILKDEGLINYKMNQSLQYVFAHFKEFTDANIMEQIDIASRVSQDILTDAGDVGTRVHDYREEIFAQWIRTGVMPEDFLSFIKPEDTDVRVISCLRALRKFVDECGYVPVACELLVFSDDLKTAGTLDDLGLMRKVITSGSGNCDHLMPNLFDKNSYTNFVVHPENGKHTCVRCGFQFRYQFVLADMKTSNQFKDHYFFQVALYWWMFHRLTGLKPEQCYIVKLSKEDGRYKLENLKMPGKLAQFARYMLKTNEGMDFIKSLRKDNQRNVVPLV